MFFAPGTTYQASLRRDWTSYRGRIAPKGGTSVLSYLPQEMGPHGDTAVVSARTNGGSWGGGGGRGSPAAARRTDSIINHAGESIDPSFR